MRKRPRATGEEKQTVPAYIVTFSDMVTLLLTFFVLLLSLAEVQDPEMFNRGRDSFFESLRLCGLGALLGSEVTVELGADKTMHPTTEPETSRDRTIDEYREKLRRIFERVSASAMTLPSQLVGRRLDFTVTDVRFPSGQAALSPASRASLSRFCVDLQQSVRPDTSTLYVLGLAGDEPTEMRQWTLSAERARSVARVLREMLARPTPDQPAAQRGPDEPAWRILWWGAGPGGNWAGQDCPGPGQSQILIAVLRSDP